MSAKLSIVFAHGLFADGSCYSKVIPALLADGHQVVSAQNSLDSIQGDVAAVTRALGRVSSPAILVGHSWGGAVITAEGTEHRVAGLVYIAALAPDEGETGQSLLGRYPTELFKHLSVAEGRVWMLPSGIGSFAGDLPEQEQEVVFATQGVPTSELLNQKIEGAAWRSKPSWYILAKNDHSVHPDLQRFFVKRMGATTYEVESSHVTSSTRMMVRSTRLPDGRIRRGQFSPASGGEHPRDGIPVKWVLIQQHDPDRPMIYYHHVRGVTRGMEVDWTFEPHVAGVLVRIRHWFNPPWPMIVGPWAAQHILCDQFVHNIAGKTLHRVKQLAERG